MRFIELLDNIYSNWSIKEKARYVYTNLCKNVLYDERFAYGHNKELMQQIYDREIDIEENEDERVVCNSLNKVYKKLLDRLGINCRIIHKKSKIERLIEVDDAALLFWDEEGNKYYTNIIGDIQNCKYGLRSKYFGITKNDYFLAKDVKEITPEELKKIDKNINYIKYDYNNVVFDMIIAEVKNTNNFKKFLISQGIDANHLSKDEILKNKIQYMTRLTKFREKKAGADETKKFYQKLFSASVLDKFESKKFRTFEFVKEENNGENIDVISCLEINLYDGLVYYIYSKEEQTYIQLTPEELKEKLKGYRERRGKPLLIEYRKNSQQDWDDLTN